jgi:hypothetical protein
MINRSRPTANADVRLVNNGWRFDPDLEQEPTNVTSRRESSKRARVAIGDGDGGFDHGPDCHADRKSAVARPRTSDSPRLRRFRSDNKTKDETREHSSPQ